jgi:hypothetical protein
MNTIARPMRTSEEGGGFVDERLNDFEEIAKILVAGWTTQ